jgi:hypothetical protein
MKYCLILPAFLLLITLLTPPGIFAFPFSDNVPIFSYLGFFDIFTYEKMGLIDIIKNVVISDLIYDGVRQSSVKSTNKEFEGSRSVHLNSAY